jgi:hypothetical protein
MGDPKNHKKVCGATVMESLIALSKTVGTAPHTYMRRSHSSDLSRREVL